MGGITAEVIDNIGDGQWVQVRYVAVPDDPAAVGSEELCHSQDILEIIPAGRAEP